MAIRERIAAYKAAVGANASGELRFGLTDSEGVALALELGPEKCRHAGKVGSSLKDLEAALKAANAAKDQGVDAVVAAALKVDKYGKEFWNAFEGELVDGVTVIRRRA